ncbi:MAG: M3 family metallopeptidase [Verrucomicrobiota bacterium]
MEHPFLADDFAFRWSQLRPEAVEPDIAEALRQAQAAIDALSALDDDPEAELTYANTFQALGDSSETLDRAWGLVNHLDSVRNEEALRAALNRALPQVTAFYARIPLNDKLWRVLKRFAESAEAKELSGARRRFLEETVDNFKLAGADLPPEKKLRLEKLQSELAERTQKYSENVLDATNAWDLVIDDPARLAGLPESARRAARQSAREKGLDSEASPRWRFTLHAPSVIPVMTYAEDEALRREVWEASSRVGRQAPHDNTPLVLDILRLRQEKAELLGKAHFGDLVTERRMAKSGQAALDFVEDLHRRVKPAFDREQAALREFRREKTGDPELLEPWEAGYWAEKRRRALYDFDDEELRPYLAIDEVIGGLFQLAQRVFDLRIERRPSVFIDRKTGARTPADAPNNAVEVWHPDVKFYEVTDAEGRPMGAFYADWHPREEKRGGAWFNDLRTGDRDPALPRTPHLGLICGNLSPSVDGDPALLTHDEVETIFHEFGHLLHHLCGEVEVKSLNGVSVAWDFVELPSQIMENWCWERESLDLFARHYKTGEAIPEPLFDAMRRARNFMAASGMMRQLAFGKLDLELHLNYAGKPIDDLDQLVRTILADYTARYRTQPPSMVRRFTHLFASSTGYASGYYSYKWAEVLDADAFTRFLNEGLLSPEVGREFREKILSQGDARDAAELFRDFMGRDPDLNALLRRADLLPDESAA